MTARFFIRFMALLVLAVLADAAVAQEEQFTNYHCALTPPLGWKRVKTAPQTGLVVTYANGSHKSLLMLIINDRNKVGPVDDRFINEFDRGVQTGSKGEDKKVSGKIIQIAGINAYERMGERTLNGKLASTWTRNVPANGIFYTIEAMRFDGKADDDYEVRQGMDSFRFLGPPVPPGPISGQSRAYRTGYKLGYYTARIVLIGGVIAVIFIIVRAVS